MNRTINLCLFQPIHLSICARMSASIYVLFHLVMRQKQKNNANTVPMADLTYGCPRSDLSITAFKLFKCSGFRPRTFLPTTERPTMKGSEI